MPETAEGSPGWGYGRAHPSASHLLSISARDRLKFASARSRLQPENTAHDDLRCQENQDHPLDHVDDLNGHPSLDLHKRSASTHGAQEERGEHDANRIGLAEESNRDAVKANVRPKHRRIISQA